MTEKQTVLPLSPVAERLIVHWGEMGARWGINRTVAQIHALLYLAARPLHAAEIADTLSVARSNVSTGLRELQAWGIVKITHVLGDRRDYFEGVTDIWQLVRMILEERWRREMQPSLAVLEACVADAERSGRDQHTRHRLQELRAFFATLESWYQELKAMEPSEMKRVVRLGGKVRRLLRISG